MLDVWRWLHDNGFERFADLFHENEIDGEALLYLDDSDLEKLGIAMGPRKKLLKAIASLRGRQADPPAELEARVAPASAELSTSAPDAERRNLTVMFFDLVGSTALSGKLDPEDMREVITSYQNAVAGVVTRFEGHVAKYMGDGVLCFFGWPRAHEDEAERAVRAGLAIMHAMAGMKAPDGETLLARAGIATGLVVVGDLVGEGAAQEEAVVGEAPNLAARLQALAEPGQIVLSGTTRHLLGNLFDLTDLGPQDLKGIAGPAEAFAVTGERALESRFEARRPTLLSPLVGRDQELALILERWRQAKAGEGQVVLLIGEAGIGKSRIAQGVIDTLGAEPHVRLSYQCSPYHGDSALYPAIQQLTLAAGIVRDDGPDARLDKLEILLSQGSEDARGVTPYIAALLGIEYEGRYGKLELGPQQQRTRTLQILVDQLVGLAGKKPVLFCIEDLHWVDPTTLELIELALDNMVEAPVLLLMTARPTFDHGVGGHPIVTRLALNRLGQSQVAAIAERITGGKALPKDLLEEIASKTDGVPLFVEELTKTVLESGQLRETETAFELDGPMERLAIPSTLHDSLMARLDRLQPMKEVAQFAACIGREFGHGLLETASPLSPEKLQEALERLITAELIFRRGHPPEAVYIFKHALVRDAAYESLLKSKRQTIHARLLKALEKSGETPAELLAHHAGEAGFTEMAVALWRQAGENALVRSANLEAVGHLQRSLEMLLTLPDSEARGRQELALQITLGPALMATRGYAAAEASAAYSRAHELSERLNDREQAFKALWGRFAMHTNTADHRAALGLAEQLHRLAQRSERMEHNVEANLALGIASMYRGQLQSARTFLEETRALYKPEQHAALSLGYGGFDSGVIGRTYLAWTCWLLGDVEQAVAYSGEARKLSGQLDNSYTMARFLYWDAILLRYLEDWRTMTARAEQAVAIAVENRFALVNSVGSIMLGWARLGLGEEAEGARQIRQAVDAYRANRAEKMQLPHFLLALAEAERARGRLQHGLDALSDAIAIVESTGERYLEAELHRHMGELLLDRAPDHHKPAEDEFQKAISVARSQCAKSLELRAAVSLARLWADQGERQKARDLLAPIYGWFTEGFDTPDLKSARTVLDELR